MKQTSNSQEDLFTPIDHAILRASVKKLPGLLSMIVEMRFWQRLTLDDISSELGVSVPVVERALTKAAKLLREECLRNPAFSRSKYSLIENFRSLAVA